MSESPVSNSCWSKGSLRWPILALLLALVSSLSFGGLAARAQPGSQIEASPEPQAAAPAVVVPTPEQRAVADRRAEQQARLEAAQRARTAALQQIATERDRLAAYDQTLSAAETRLDTAGGRQALEAEAALGLRQQAIEARSSPARADAVYDDLRAELRTVRRRLNATLDAARWRTDPAAAAAQPDQ